MVYVAAISDGFGGIRGTIPDNDLSAQIQNTMGMGELEEEGGGETEPLLQASEPLNQGINVHRNYVEDHNA